MEVVSEEPLLLDEELDRVEVDVLEGVWSLVFEIRVQLQIGADFLIVVEDFGGLDCQQFFFSELQHRVESQHLQLLIA